MENKRLEEFEKFIQGKRIAIIGLGVSNIPLIDYMHEKNASVTVFDDRERKDISKEILDKIERYGFSYIGGKENLKQLQGFNVILRSPSCLPTKPELVEEEERGAIITTEIELLMKMAPCKIIGITGTEGKTTTSSIIAAIIKQSGINCHLGGNIGTPLFTKLSEMQKEDIIVLEMSSFQLMGMDVSPDISLVTNIYPDHLNVHSSYEEYQEAKKSIFLNQDENGLVVLNYDNAITKKFSKEAKGKVVFFSSKEKLENGYIYDQSDGNIKYCKNGIRITIINKNDIKLRGIHNYENICAALAITASIVDMNTQIQAIKEFIGVEHRLEFVREINGVKYYNDSIGTSPASTIAGLNAFDENIVLLAGGADKDLDYTEIGKKIAEKVGTLILCGPTSDKIEQATQNALNGKEINILRVTNMKEAVNQANIYAKSGDIVLLSPASTSFDLYKNFAERGNIFKNIVNSL